MLRLLTAIVVASLTSATVMASPARANVIAGGGFSSSYAGESSFTNLGPGESGQFSAIFFNDGTQTWLPGVVGLLICAADKVNCNVPSNTNFAKNWFSPTVYATVKSAVEPGSNAFFIYEFTVPTAVAPGTVTSFNGDVGLIATGALFHPDGYFHTNTAPKPTLTLALSPTTVSLPIGGLQQFTLSGQPAGASVTWSVTGGCGAINSQGLFVATAMNSPTQPCSVVANVTGGTGSAPVTIFGQATQLSCAASPASILADGGASAAGTSTVTVSLKDANGNVVANAGTPQITTTNNTPALASMTPIGLQNPAGGALTSLVSSTTTPGTIVFSAVGPGLTGCSVMITSTMSGAPAKTVATFLSTPLAADGTSTTTLQVDVLDANGLRVIGDNLTDIFIVQSSGADICTLLSSNHAVASQGRATFTVQSTTTPGQCRIGVTPNIDTISGTSATLTTQLAGAANRLAVLSSDSPHPAATGGSCAASGINTDRSCTRIVVAVEDANGVIRTGDNSTAITVARDTGSCALAGGGDVAGQSSLTAVGGKATFLFTSAGAYEGCRLLFTSTGLVSASAIAVWTAGPADHLLCGISPSTIGVNSGAIAVGTVTVRDLAGNIVTTGTYPVTFVRTSGAFTTLVTSSLQYSSFGFASFSLKPGTSTGTDVWSPALSAGSLPNVAGVTASCLVTVV